MTSNYVSIALILFGFALGLFPFSVGANLQKVENLENCFALGALGASFIGSYVGKS